MLILLLAAIQLQLAITHAAPVVPAAQQEQTSATQERGPKPGLHYDIGRTYHFA